MSPSLIDVVEGIYQALQPVADELEGLQLYPYYVRNPTPPCIDVYPSDPFQAPAGFGPGRIVFFTVRARVSQADVQSGQEILLMLLDTSSPASVENALTADGLGLGLDGVGFPPDGTPTGYRTYDDTLGGEFLGVEWRLEVPT